MPAVILWRFMFRFFWARYGKGPGTLVVLAIYGTVVASLYGAYLMGW
jgi:hypothetical protein